MALPVSTAIPDRLKVGRLRATIWSRPSGRRSALWQPVEPKESTVYFSALFNTVCGAALTFGGIEFAEQVLQMVLNLVNRRICVVDHDEGESCLNRGIDVEEGFVYPCIGKFIAIRRLAVFYAHLPGSVFTS